MRRFGARSIAPRVKRVTRLVCVASLFFVAGILFQARHSQFQPVDAASDHLYELMIYHAIPGKAPALASIFADFSKLQAKHGLTAVGYWLPKTDSPEWKDTFVYLLVHRDHQSAEANWTLLHADPAFHPYFEAAAPLIQQKDGTYEVDEVFIAPTQYSAAK